VVKEDEGEGENGNDDGEAEPTVISDGQDQREMDV
jgi:hypothetical protein